MTPSPRPAAAASTSPASRGGAWPTRPGGPVHLYTYLALFHLKSPPGRDGRLVRRSPARPRLVDRAVARDARRRRSRARARGCPCGARSAIMVRVVGIEQEGPGRRVDRPPRGRRLDRLPVAGGRSCSGASSARGLWWQAHPYSLCLRVTSCGPSRTSAAAAPAWPDSRGDPRRDRRAVRGLPPQTVARDGAARRRQGGTAPLWRLGWAPDADVTVLLRASSRRELVLRERRVTEVRARPSSGRGTRYAAAVPDRPRRARSRHSPLCGPDALSRRLATELDKAPRPSPVPTSSPSRV